MVIRKPIFANKEDANAREALVLYENKQYKKVLKLVDQNLKKNSSHAESLALKGVSNFQLGHKEEAETYIVKALAKGPSNYLVNHLAGIYYRGVENYVEAAKWYQAAVDNGSQNTPILRDLSFIQTQIRDYKHLVLSRQKFLESQPGYRANWTAVAVAHHLNKDYDAAVKTLTKIEGVIKEHLQEQDRYEQSECVLYKNEIIAESGNYARALQELDEDSLEIRDRVSFMENKAKYLMLLDKQKDASVLYRQLIQRNPDNNDYYLLLEEALGISNGHPDVRLKVYDKLALFYPRSDPPQFLPLTFLPASHPEFYRRATKYILGQLKRGVPATFVNIKPLYKNCQKIALIQSIVENFLNEEVPSSIPTVYVWTEYFLALHYLFLGDVNAATSHIDKALKHSPTLVELYIMKARVVKHMGDVRAASDIMQEGRKLDLQDRFVNSKATKYLLRANKVEEAIDCISLFTKLEEGAVNGLKDLHIMQVNWILIESAEAYQRLYKENQKALEIMDPLSEEYAGVKETMEINRGLALKRFQAVMKVFQVYYSDQFDYHSYCMRRGTPRDYVAMLKWEDKIHATSIYVRAVKGLMDMYWEILASKGKIEDEAPSVPQKKTKAGRAKPTAKKRIDLIARVESEKNDQDPLGQKLYTEKSKSKTLIAEMEDFAKQLTKEADSYLYTWQLAMDVYMNESKYVLALQALRNWAKLADDQNIKRRLVGEKVVALKQAVDADTSANQAIVKVAQKGLASAFPGIEDGNEQFLSVYCN